MSLDVDFSELVGKTIVGVLGKVGDDEFTIETKDGQTYVMHHCGSVTPC